MVAMAASVGTVLINSFAGHLTPGSAESLPEKAAPEKTLEPLPAQTTAGDETRTLALTVKGMH
jgi:hypothetical protein